MKRALTILPLILLLAACNQNRSDVGGFPAGTGGAPPAENTEYSGSNTAAKRYKGPLDPTGAGPEDKGSLGFTSAPAHPAEDRK